MNFLFLKYCLCLSVVADVWVENLEEVSMDCRFWFFLWAEMILWLWKAGCCDNMV